VSPDLTYVFLAGYGDSGDGHWQRAWLGRLPNAVWVAHEDWFAAQREEWVADVQKALWQISGPMVVVAHSLGCLLLAEWCRNHEDPSLVGAFLVAVPNPDGINFPGVVEGFEDPTAMELPFPAIVVASQDDPYADIEFARTIAETWGARFVDIGAKGHINADSGVGDWDEGWEMLREFVGTLEA
jgi:predicted alpha/beta hydrolase family esterase